MASEAYCYLRAAWNGMRTPNVNTRSIDGSAALIGSMPAEADLTGAEKSLGLANPGEHRAVCEPCPR